MATKIQFQLVKGKWYKTGVKCRVVFVVSDWILCLQSWFQRGHIWPRPFKVIQRFCWGGGGSACDLLILFASVFWYASGRRCRLSPKAKHLFLKLILCIIRRIMNSLVWISAQTNWELIEKQRGQHHRIQVSELWNFSASVDLFILDVCYLFNWAE